MPRVTITIPERTPQPYRFDLLREVVTIGRGLDNDIVVGCGSVSGKHSEMRRVKGGYEIIDVGSTNGIKVDGIRRQTVVLHTGMTVKLGDVEFGFTLSEDELAELATESEATTKAAVEEKEDAMETEISEKPVSKEKEQESESKSDKKAQDDDGPDKLPPVRLDKKKEKEEQEAEKRKKEERKERERREKEARAEREEKSEKREKRERSEKDKDRDEFAESKAVTIGSGFILFTLIAAAAAFFYGAHTRHEKDTGGNLLKGIVNKEDAKNTAPTEVEDKPEGGAE